MPNKSLHERYYIAMQESYMCSWALKERLFSENINIFKRVHEIYKIAEILNKKNSDKINFSNLLIEITKRTLNDNKFESNLFFH